MRRDMGEDYKSLRGSTAADSLLQQGPRRVLDEDQIEAITSSEDFLDFVDRSTKVIERALDEDYDVLADYALGQVAEHDEEDGGYDGVSAKGKRRLREIMQFWDGRWSKRRMITSVDFSPKVSGSPDSGGFVFTVLTSM